MSAQLEPEQAARLGEAERRWLAQCAARLRPVGDPQPRRRAAASRKEARR